MEVFVYRNGCEKIEEKIAVSELHKILADPDSFVWVDMESPTPEEEDLVLARVFNFHPLTIEDCRLNHSQPKAEEFPGYLYMIVHGIRPEEEDLRHFETKELDCYLGRNFVVTYHHEHFRSIEIVKRQIRSSPVACQRGASYLLHQILDQIADFYLPVIDEYEGYITDLEDRIFELKKADNEILAEIIAIKRSIIRLRRVSSKQMNVLYRMSHGEFDLIDEKMLPFYRDVFDHLLRVSDLAESYRDLMASLMDTYLSVIANRTNEVMKALTLISAMLLPLTVITGIYGMNFDNMPELKTRNGYFIVLGIMAAVVVLMLLYFRRKGWLGDNEEVISEEKEARPRTSLQRRKAKRVAQEDEGYDLKS